MNKMGDENKMANVITMQPVPSRGEKVSPLTEDTPITVPPAPKEATPPPEELNEDPEEEKHKKKRRSSTVEDCCFYLDEDDCLYSYFCIRVIANCFVGCGRCTEHCLEGCCNALCNCESGDPGNHGQTDGCCDDDCCNCGDDCCDCGDNCCDGGDDDCDCFS